MTKNKALALRQKTSYNFGLVERIVVAVAQLVEHGIVIPRVAGSSPVGHPKNFR